jgi:hypothetical protein
MKSFKQFIEEAFTSPESKLAKKIRIKHGLLVLPQTHEACKKYGMQTKWCITNNDVGHWNSYIKNQKLTPYFVIVNQDYAKYLEKEVYFDLDLSKIAIMINISDEIEHVWDAKDQNITVEYGRERTNKLLNLIGVDINTLKFVDIEDSEYEFILYDEWKSIIDLYVERYPELDLTEEISELYKSYGVAKTIAEELYDGKNTYERYLDIISKHQTELESILTAKYSMRIFRSRLDMVTSREDLVKPAVIKSV